MVAAQLGRTRAKHSAMSFRCSGLRKSSRIPRARARWCSCAPAKLLIGTIGASGRSSAISAARAEPVNQAFFRVGKQHGGQAVAGAAVER
jgi:hypothetical protein